MTPRTTAVVGATLVAASVALGAFGTHGLEGAVPVERLGTFETATRYLTYAGLGLLIMAAVARSGPAGLTTGVGRSAALVCAGTAVFCGALYGLVAGGPSLFGAVAPLGGALMIGGWAYLALVLFRGGVTPPP